MHLLICLRSYVYACKYAQLSSLILLGLLNWDLQTVAILVMLLFDAEVTHMEIHVHIILYAEKFAIHPHECVCKYRKGLLHTHPKNKCCRGHYYAYYIRQ